MDLDEEEDLTLVDVTRRARQAFDVDRVTRRFYDRFKTEHATFLKFIKGITATGDSEWYASLMLNRLMFVYFIQKKGFLDGDPDYLRNRMKIVRQQKGKDKFLSFYRYFLLRLFHEGLGQPPIQRTKDLDLLLGEVPYLNGGLFDVHELERSYPDIQIADDAFERLFDFFDAYQWHLDERPLRADNEINPDVLGYIFEKYINQKQMGAYYTKEDITGYIARNTVVPFLFNAAEKKCAIAFKPDSAVWRLLRDDPDRYIYPAIRKGVDMPLPPAVAEGVHDVAKRRGWNGPTTPEYGLPTETWREYVARRQRCEELRAKLKAGEIHDINDLTTLNLDICQFAEDVIDNCEGPELLRAFWHAIKDVSVLDPTCGSGAFLFAALNILEPLYEACLERMRAFLEDLQRSGEKHHPEKFSDFRKILEDVGRHPNHRYFILKSIIIGNLYGVDIMEEAVEICKLRLFLKLVAQVENAKQVEPLPDIDFNIRPGNTLVGFASLDEVKKTLQGNLGFGKKDVDRIVEEAEIVDRAFTKFRQMQTGHGMDAKEFSTAKTELRRRLDKLRDELDRFLAGEYGVDSAKPKLSEQWRKSHQPFHWLAEFYGIMSQGGFDVIIGNPPYVEWHKVRDYDVLPGALQTRECGNLYACFSERGCYLLGEVGRMGMIIPVSCVATERMTPLREVWSSTTQSCWLSYYSGDAHPSVLFPGVKFRLCIAMHARSQQGKNYLFSGRYARWLPDERQYLFPLQFYSKAQPGLVYEGLIPKLGSDTLLRILEKTFREQRRLSELVLRKNGRHEVYCHRIVAHFMKAMDFIPFFRNERDGEKKSEDYKVFPVNKPALRPVLSALLNSSLFYWFFLVYSDVYHCGRELILSFPCDLEKLGMSHGHELAELNVDLMNDLRKHSRRRRIPYRTTGYVEYDEYYPRGSKLIIDEIDRVLAKHYGLTDEELDFIINYDIKYRMGQEGGEGDEA